MSSNKSRDEIWSEWRDLVNLTATELQDWLETDESKSVGDSESGESTGHKSGKKIVEIKQTNKDQLSDTDWEHMAKVVGYINRHIAQNGPKDDVETSPWRYSLMNWGHDSLKNN